MIATSCAHNRGDARKEGHHHQERVLSFIILTQMTKIHGSQDMKNFTTHSFAALLMICFPGALAMDIVSKRQELYEP